MKVLVVCEDPTHDQFIVKPIVQRIFDDLGRRARIDVLTDPHLRGFRDVIEQLPSIVADHPMVDIFVVIVDRDCDRTNNNAKIEHAATVDPRVICCCAIEEVEVWMLALFRDQLPDWQTVRADCDVKEHFAIPLLQQLDLGGPGYGRKAAMRDLGQQWRSVLQLCTEIQSLRTAVRAAIT